MPKKIKHTVIRPGHGIDDRPVEIPVAQDLASVPGIPLRDSDVSFHSKIQPLESWRVEKGADQDWAWSVYSDDFKKYRRHFDEIIAPSIETARRSGNITAKATKDKNIDVTKAIRTNARDLGFGEVGFTKMDRRYIYKQKKSWVKFPHAICLAWEQDYEDTQTIVSMDSERAHYGTYFIMANAGLRLADYIRSLGYRAQVHHPTDSSCPYIPMFVNAGLGQLGANGQLLSPHFGSRARLMLITTEAPVNYDQPIDYGIHKFCDQCQVCVRRCPAKALVKEKVWWRGVFKNKVVYDRCRPVMVRYDGCGVCMKVCPIQKFGMKSVMSHYVNTGKVLGKDTDDLEGYTFLDKGYFGVGVLPGLRKSDFNMPHGSREEWAINKFKDRLKSKDNIVDRDIEKFISEIEKAVEMDGMSLGGSGSE